MKKHSQCTACKGLEPWNLAGGIYLLKELCCLIYQCPMYTFLSTYLWRKCPEKLHSSFNIIFYLYSGRMHPVAYVTMNRNNEPSLTTAFKRALLSRTIRYMFRLQFKPSSGVSNQNTKSNRNGSVVKQLNRLYTLYD
jgi:hypothetical protein